MADVKGKLNNNDNRIGKKKNPIGSTFYYYFFFLLKLESKNL